MKRSQPDISMANDGSLDVKAIREGMGLTQAQFSDRFGINVATLRNWEQRRRKNLDASTVLLLKLIQKKPRIVQKLVAEERSAKIVA